MESKSVTYRRQGTHGTLKLRAGVDVSEAADLHKAALRALEDEKAASVSVEASQLERLDMSTVQILLALRKDVRGAGRGFAVEGLAPGLQDSLTNFGISLD